MHAKQNPQQPNGEEKVMPSFQLVYDPATRGTAFRVDPGFPLDSLVNGLFTALLAYGSINLQAMMQNQARQQGQRVVGPDGQPMPNI